MTIQPLDSGKSARVTVSDYRQKGDSMSLVVDLANNHPLTAAVKSSLDSGKEPYTLDASLGTFAGGITYASNHVLEAPSKNLKVTVENSGYQKSAPLIRPAQCLLILPSTVQLRSLIPHESSRRNAGIPFLGQLGHRHPRRAGSSPRVEAPSGKCRAKSLPDCPTGPRGGCGPTPGWVV